MVLIVIGGRFQQGQHHQGQLHRVQESDPHGDPGLRAEVVLAEHLHEPSLTSIRIGDKGNQAGEQTASFAVSRTRRRRICRESVQESKIRPIGIDGENDATVVGAASIAGPIQGVAR